MAGTAFEVLDELADADLRGIADDQMDMVLLHAKSDEVAMPLGYLPAILGELLLNVVLALGVQESNPPLGHKDQMGEKLGYAVVAAR